MQALSISACARALAAGTVSAAELADAALDRITALDGSIRSFTAVTPERARAQALAVDTARAGGDALGPLAGVPYAVKNLFDIEGVTTLAGARLLEGNPPATADATVIQRLSQAGAVLVGALNMDAYAYGFTTENTHYGTTRNPSDTTRVAGGSSGGSAAAVAAGFVSFALGTDTNGSIRVPSSFCGVFGLKPTFGRLTRAGAYPFATSLDHVGPFAGSAEDLALVYDVLQGPDARDPRCTRRPVTLTVPGIDAGVRGLRIAVLGGYFEQWADAHARAAAAHAARALGATDVVTLPEAERARAAAFVITASESGAFYLDRLRERAEEFEPLSRERLIAGAMLPAAWYLKAQRFRRWFQQAAARVFENYDLLIAPATPCTATLVGAETMKLNGVTVPVRPSLGLLTQPISFIGLPVATAPLRTEDGRPIGVQLIAAPWREDLCLRAARALEHAGIARAAIVPELTA